MIDSGLENPVWASLDGDLARFAIGSARAKRFHPAIGPLAAVRDATPQSLVELGELVRTTGPLALFGTGAPLEVPGATIALQAEGVQMVFAGGLEEAEATVNAGRDTLPIPLGEADYPQMLALARLTEPGPFAERTGDLGHFWGIREDGRLLAMAGQRMRLPGHVEVSAVCTHPDARGRGLAARLSQKVMAAILADGRVPILHSYAGNAVALALYRRLGFVERRRMVLTQYAPQA